jgi:hypothetical protein
MGTINNIGVVHSGPQEAFGRSPAWRNGMALGRGMSGPHTPTRLKARWVAGILLRRILGISSAYQPCRERYNDNGLGEAKVEYQVMSAAFALPAQICYKVASASDQTDHQTDPMSDQRANQNQDSARFGPICA